MLFILVVETLITHGFIESLSIFVVESVTTFWYFKEANKQGEDYNKLINLWETFKILPFSLSTIIYGFVFILIPEWFISIFKYTSRKCGMFKGCGELRLSKFCFIFNVMQSLSFF